MIEAATWEFKQKLSDHCEKLDLEDLTPHLAEQVTSGIREALKASGIAALGTFLEAYEVDEAAKQVGDVVYRFNNGSVIFRKTSYMNFISYLKTINYIFTRNSINYYK